MLRRQILTGTALVVLTALFHVAGITGLVNLLSWMGQTLDLPDPVNMLLIFGFAVLSIIVIHGVEAWCWALVYRKLGQFDDMGTAFYFSVVTTTTLGYGDFTLSERWRILASIQAIGGLILFGATTAFLFEIIRRFFPES